MIITIQIQNQQDYQWLLPFLEALKKTSAKVQVKGSLPLENGLAEKRKDFLQFLDQNAISVNKVEIPGRDERNAR